jgi:DNA-binding MarR family transcriptional regulator
VQATKTQRCELEQTLPVALMRIGHQLKAVTARTPDEAWAVSLMHRVHEHGGCRISELAHQSGLDISTVSRHVAHLVEGGHLARSEDPADRRATRVELTAKGRRLLTAAPGARIALIHDAVADWSDDDVKKLNALIQRLAQTLDARHTETEHR